MTTLEFIFALVLGIIASSGFWGVVLYKVQKTDNKKDNSTKLLLGLAHQEIIRTAVRYIDRGSISKDEYQDLMKYLYEPYKALGGNGTAEKFIKEIDELPIIAQ